MKITYTVVPANALPLGLHALVVEGDRDIVIQLSATATQLQLAEALTECVNEHAENSWVHAGDLDFDSLLR